MAPDSRPPGTRKMAGCKFQNRDNAGETAGHVAPVLSGLVLSVLSSAGKASNMGWGKSTRTTGKREQEWATLNSMSVCTVRVRGTGLHNTILVGAQVLTTRLPAPGTQSQSQASSLSRPCQCPEAPAINTYVHNAPYMRRKGEACLIACLPAGFQMSYVQYRAT